jgi:L-ascorbate metabolism protein UlaG (beta-lactamase superfamily)
MNRRLLALLICVVGAAQAACRTPPADPDSLPADGGQLLIRPITHGSVEVAYGSRVIFVDPAPPVRLYNDLPKATHIFVTHDHEDHFNAQIIRQLSTPTTTVVVSRSLDGHVPGAVAMRNGEERTFGDVKVAAVAMYNKASGFHVRGDGNGYVLTVGGKRLYFGGDTECVADPRSLEHVDIAFLPMNLPFTMSPAQAADCAKQFQPKIVYPYHYRGSNPSEFVAAMAGTPTDVRLRKWY